MDVFLREESIEHLQRRAPGLGKDDAEQVAVAVGDLPLAVEQAGAWIAETATPVSAYLEQLAQQAARVLALNQPPGYPEPVAATWNISIERLQSVPRRPSGCCSSAPSSRPSRSPRTCCTARR